MVTKQNKEKKKSAPKRVDQAANALRSRIVGLEYVRPSELIANPKNWRGHPSSQITPLTNVLKKIGFVTGNVVRKLPNGKYMLIDGHARTGIAEANGDKPIPVIVTDLNEAEANEVLASFDIFTEMAETNKDVLNSLLKSPHLNDLPLSAALLQNGLDVVALEKLVSQSNSLTNEQIDALTNNRAEKLETSTGALTLVEDMGFHDSGEPYGIPKLKGEKIAALPVGMETWLGSRETDHRKPPYWMYVWKSYSIKGMDTSKAFLGFFRDDSHFEELWNKPALYTTKILNRKFRGVIEPNYSLWTEQALAIHIWNTYRTRWVGRYFQEAGIDIIPCVQYGGNPLDLEFIFAGIPKGANSVALQYNSSRTKELSIGQTQDFLRILLKRIDPKGILFYTPIDFYEKALRPIVNNTPHAVVRTVSDLVDVWKESSKSTKPKSKSTS